jgi:hypothetical protein
MLNADLSGKRKEWTVEGSEACQWYNTLSALAESLVEARQELFEKSVEELTPIDASGDILTGAESADSLLCKKPGWLWKKAIKITHPLSLQTRGLLTVAYNHDLLTEIETTIFPLPEAA